jgi:hypothetical protein
MPGRTPASRPRFAVLLAAIAALAARPARAEGTWPHDGKFGHGTRHLLIRNHLPKPIWIGLQSGGSPELRSDAFQLGPGRDTVYEVPNVWRISRIWGRTEEKQSGPATLIECNLGKRDWYGISLVDGYNLPVTVTPIPGTYVKIDSADPFQCGSISCTEDLLATCPEELRRTDALGITSQCLSACSRWNEDGYCCRGAYDSEQACRPSTWDRDYPAIFKAACPTAVTYAFDDSANTYVCGSGPEGIGPDYEIGFGETRAAPVPTSLRTVIAGDGPRSFEIAPGLWRGPAGKRVGPYDTRGRTWAAPKKRR